MPVFLFRHGDAFEHKYNCAPRSADIDGLVRSVQHQNRLMQRVPIAILVHSRGEHRRWKMRPHAAAEVVQSQRHDPIREPLCARGTRSLPLNNPLAATPPAKSYRKSSACAPPSPPTPAPLPLAVVPGRTRTPSFPWCRHHRSVGYRDSISAVGSMTAKAPRRFSLR